MKPVSRPIFPMTLQDRTRTLVAAWRVFHKAWITGEIAAIPEAARRRIDANRVRYAERLGLPPDTSFAELADAFERAPSAVQQLLIKELRPRNVASTEETSAAMPSPTLVVTDALRRRFITLDKPLFILGSDKPRLFSLRRHWRVDLRVEDADVSSVHAEIVAKDARSIIRDKKSRFGTFVNGARVTEKVLEHGDSIRLGQSGDTEIIFFIGELPKPGE
jgi:hypothetical protein